MPEDCIEEDGRSNAERDNRYFTDVERKKKYFTAVQALKRTFIDVEREN